LFAQQRLRADQRRYAGEAIAMMWHVAEREAAKQAS
jgi:hypothetical protein